MDSCAGKLGRNRGKTAPFRLRIAWDRCVKSPFPDLRYSADVGCIAGGMKLLLVKRRQRVRSLGLSRNLANRGHHSLVSLFSLVAFQWIYSGKSGYSSRKKIDRTTDEFDFPIRRGERNSTMLC